jgi:hypothetical protein
MGKITFWNCGVFDAAQHQSGLKYMTQSLEIKKNKCGKYCGNLIV